MRDPAAMDRRRYPVLGSSLVLFVVLGVVLASAAASVSIFYRLGVAQERLGGRVHETALWAATQLQREAWRMDDAVRMWRNGDAPFEAVAQRLDILASRVEYCRDGDFDPSEASAGRERSEVDAIATDMALLDVAVGALPTATDRIAAALAARRIIRRMEAAAERLANLVSQDSAEARTGVRRETAQLHAALGFSALVLVAAVGLALAALLVQNRALRLARRRAEAVGIELQLAADAAQAAARAKAVFLATMSHEIRTPMNGVLGAASLLGAGPLTGEQRRRVDMIAACGRALLALIDDILDFSRLEAGRTDFAMGHFAPEELLQAVADICAPMVRAKGLDCVMAVAPDCPAVLRSDQHRLRQVLVNLVSNAVKFTEAGSVVVTLAMADGMLLAEVADTGAGIPAASMKLLFQEFEQGDPAVGRRHGGAGLGLAICRRIIESLGGRIEVESAPGEGSRFRFVLPVMSGEVAATPTQGAGLVLARDGAVAAAMGMLLRGAGFTPAEAPAPGGIALLHAEEIEHATLRGMRVIRFGPGTALAPPVTAAALRAEIAGRTDAGAPVALPPALPPMRLLVAEDNAMNREVMQQVLSTMGHEVHLAADGAEALEVLRREGRFDAVLLDLQMPVMDGLSTARAIRALPEPLSRTRLLAVTANALSSDRDACLAAGMDGFLAKPVTIGRLTAALAALTGQARDAEPAVPALAGGAPVGGAIDAEHRGSIRAALRPGALERLVATFWEEIGGEVSALLAAGPGGAARDSCLHRIAGSAATLGYGEVAAIARAGREDGRFHPELLLQALRAALAADAGLLDEGTLAAARACLG